MACSLISVSTLIFALKCIKANSHSNTLGPEVPVKCKHMCKITVKNFPNSFKLPMHLQALLVVTYCTLLGVRVVCNNHKCIVIWMICIGVRPFLTGKSKVD